MARPNFPDKGQRAGIETANVLFNCVVGERGALRDCRAETEIPADPGGFVEEVLKALPSAQLKLGPGVEPGRIVVSRISFRLD